MTKLNRTDLKNQSNTDFPTNNNKEITAQRFRDYHENDVDSNFNLEDDDATQVSYNPTNVGDWQPEGTPTEVSDALDIIANRTFVNLSDNFAVVDSDNGNDTTADVGTFSKPFKTGNASLSAIPSGGTIIVLGGSTVAFNSGINKPCNIIGFGENSKVQNVFASQGSSAPIVVANLELTSGTSLRVQANSQIIGYNLKGNNLTAVTGGGSFKLYNCEFNEVVNLLEAKNSVFNGVVLTSGATLVNIENNTFKNSLTLSDRVGGNVKKNTFDTGSNTPLLWSKGFNTSQAGLKIDIYNNTFLGSSTDVILESGTFTAQMNGRVWNNQYEQSNLLNITTNLVTRNQLNTQLI